MQTESDREAQLIRLSVLFIVLFSQLSNATTILGEKKYRDPKGDIDHNMKGGGCPWDGIDLAGMTIKKTDSEFIVTLEMTKEIKQSMGYREYYFWLDYDPSRRRGYQPYNPSSVAWPNMYADYRIFVSVDSNNWEGTTDTKIGIQDCHQSDCAQEYGIDYFIIVNVTIAGKKVIYSWPRVSLPKLDRSNHLLIGATTYYQLAHCNGEDDLPQWGDPAHEIRFKKMKKSKK